MTVPSGFVLSPKAVTESKISNVIKFGAIIGDPMEHEIDKTNCAASQPGIYLDWKEVLIDNYVNWNCQMK